MAKPVVDTVTKDEIEGLMQTIRDLYLADDIPWVIGYSGGKDSTAALQLVWLSLIKLPITQLQKRVHIIHTDTLVESPIVEKWAAGSLEKMRMASERSGLPFVVHRLTPSTDQSYWTNLLGRGYPFPRGKYRWCTDRMKIRPVNDFIRKMISSYGEIILVLGTRKAESTRRARTMAHYEKMRVRELLSPNQLLANELVFSPLSEWSNDDVWLFLMQYDNPWDLSNDELLSLYRGATADNECPLMVSEDLPSCGKSRFGCWMCTMVTEDKSMQAMINNDPANQWLLPLLAFRNEIGNITKDSERRTFRRMNGSLQGNGEKLFHGPYTKEIRVQWLHDLLELEKTVRRLAPEEYKDLQLITPGELKAIRRIWVFDKHEFDDALPRIYKEVTGEEFIDDDWISPSPYGVEEWDILREVCEEIVPDEQLSFELSYSLLDVEARSRNLNQRKGIFESLESIIRKNCYANESDALEYYLRRHGWEQEAADKTSQFDDAELEEGA